jgi:DNA-binding transcriptional regulator GbsR (MarR family)
VELFSLLRNSASNLISICFTKVKGVGKQKKTREIQENEDFMKGLLQKLQQENQKLQQEMQEQNQKLQEQNQKLQQEIQKLQQENFQFSMDILEF